MQRSSYLTSVLKGVFVGSGSDGMQTNEVAEAILRLTGKAADPSAVVVSYLGTATYDLEGPRTNQTKQFVARGCTVNNLAVGNPKATVDAAAVCAAIASSDVVVVSGGNTLFARRRWEKLGIDAALRAAAERGCVMAGGSAGLIAWFDAGHSDSMDPETYRPAMVKDEVEDGKPTDDEASSAPEAGAEAKAWAYIRVGGLGFLPGLACPHYDRTQSNGVPRSDDFDKMRAVHSGESVVCVDHWAALVVNAGRYEVLSLPDKPGSSAEGRPWVFADVVSAAGEALKKPAPVAPEGALEDILRAPAAVVLDAREELCGAQNPV